MGAFFLIDRAVDSCATIFLAKHAKRLGDLQPQSSNLRPLIKLTQLCHPRPLRNARRQNAITDMLDFTQTPNNKLFLDPVAGTVSASVPMQ
jgi:hypothetical protein